MPVVSVLFGVLLIALGVWGYQATGAPTALIPLAAGVLLVGLGFLALVERFLKHAMHAAAMIGLLGCILAGWRFILRVVQGVNLKEDMPAITTGGMTLLCGLFVALCVNSFIQVRRRRHQESGVRGQESGVRNQESAKQ